MSVMWVHRYLMSAQTYVNLHGITLAKAAHMSFREESIGEQGQKDEFG